MIILHYVALWQDIHYAEADQIMWQHILHTDQELELARNSILDIGHSNDQCPISNIQLISRFYTDLWICNMTLYKSKRTLNEWLCHIPIQHGYSNNDNSGLIIKVDAWTRISHEQNMHKTTPSKAYNCGFVEGAYILLLYLNNLQQNEIHPYQLPRNYIIYRCFYILGLFSKGIYWMFL